MRTLIVVLCLTFLGTRTFAQETQSFIQTGMNAVFAIEEDTTTALYSFTYREPSQSDLRWVLPVPPEATSVTLETNMLPIALQLLTEPSIEPPYHEGGLGCDLSVQWGWGDGYLPTPDYFLPQASELTVMNTAAAAQAFLEAGLDALSDNQRDALQQYAGQGYTFAALTITPDSDIPEADSQYGEVNLHLSPQVVVEYEGTRPLLPLAFRAASAETHLDNYDNAGIMPVTAYILATTAYIPVSTLTFQPDLTRIEGAQNQLASTMRLIDGDPIFFNQLDPEYYALVLAGIEANGGEALVSEFVDRIEPIAIDRERYSAEAIHRSEVYNRFTASSPVLSRWRTFITGAQPVADLTFEPADSFNAFHVDLNATADAAWFFGCTSRKLYDPELEARLPAGRSHIAALDLSLAHPEGWVVSTIEDQGTQLYVLSSEPVSYEQLVAKQNRQGGPLMILIAGIEQDANTPGVLERYRTGELPQLAGFPPRCIFNTFYQPSPNAIPWADVSPTEPLKSIYITTITNITDCATNEMLYQDMVRYASTYQFFLSERLRHTLFIGPLYNLTAIGYPEGWVETLDENRHRVIVPENANYVSSPAVTVFSIGDDLKAVVQERYGLTELPSGEPITFRTSTRCGYLLLLGNSFYADVIEFSAPIEQFEDNVDLLLHMANSVWVNPINVDGE